MNSVVSIDLTQLNPRLNPVRPGRFWIVSYTAGEDYAPRPRGFGGRQYRIENQGLEAPSTDRTVRMPWRNGTSGGALADVAYGYDRASRRTWRRDLTPASDAEFDRAYGYDALGQVKTANRGTLNANQTAIGGIPQEAEAWRYDEQGNWLTYDKAEDGTSVIDQSRRSNVSNQIIAIDGTNEGVNYDRNGNMTRIPTGDALTGAPRKLVWNAWDQLVDVRVESSGALLQTNAYDGLFRRTTRTLADSTVIHQYYNDQWKPIEERKDTATDPLAVYYWGARPGHRDELIRRDRDTDANGTLDETLWCLMDYFDPIAILNNAGAVQERYTYSAFGMPLILAPDYAARGSSSLAWGFLFHGQFTDAETGYQNYGYRFYFPELGCFQSRDFIFNVNDINDYCFALNNPTNGVDYYGLKPDHPDCCGTEKSQFQTDRQEFIHAHEDWKTAWDKGQQAKDNLLRIWIAVGVTGILAIEKCLIERKPLSCKAAVLTYFGLLHSFFPASKRARRLVNEANNEARRVEAKMRKALASFQDWVTCAQSCNGCPTPPAWKPPNDLELIGNEEIIELEQKEKNLTSRVESAGR